MKVKSLFVCLTVCLSINIMAKPMPNSIQESYEINSVEFQVLEILDGPITVSVSTLESLELSGDQINDYIELSLNPQLFELDGAAISFITGEPVDADEIPYIECPDQLYLKNVNVKLELLKRETQQLFNISYNRNNSMAICSYEGLVQVSDRKEYKYIANAYTAIKGLNKEGEQEHNNSEDEQVDNSERKLGDKIRGFFGKIFNASNDDSNQGQEQ